LPLATSIAALFNATALTVLLRRRLRRLEGRRLAGTVLRIVLATGLMGAAAWAVNRGLEGHLTGSFPGEVVTLTAAIAAGLCVLAASAYALHVREFRLALDAVLRRVRRARR
jgi:putative peptidoglycan lipid II flippase